jgi:TolB-like protein
MTEPRIEGATMRFGAFEIDLEARQLRKQGKRMRLEEKPFQILELLLRRAGRVVTRKMLQEKLWPKTHVAFNHNLNTALTKLRELLGDSARSPQFIETLPRVGYRFIAPVKTYGRNSFASAGGKEMLAVLPFKNLSGDPEREYFAEGLTEEVISHLGQLNPKLLGVIARTSTAQYRAAGKTIAEIGSELRVGYVLEGSVRGDGTIVRVTVQLIEAQEQTHLWSAIYDREIGEILSVQADLAGQIVKALAEKLLRVDPAPADAARNRNTFREHAAKASHQSPKG